MCLGGSFVGKASTIGIEISPNPPLIFTGVNSETKVQCRTEFKRMLQFKVKRSKVKVTA